MSALAALAGVLLLSCGRKDENSDAGNTVMDPESSTASAPVAAADVPDACAFIPRAELETLLGHELRDGDKADMPAGMSQCDFEAPPRGSVTRTFENSPLPETAGFSSVTITTYASTPETFAQARTQPGANVQDAPGIGDDAYFDGPAILRARVGNRGFGVRLHVNQPETDAGRTKLNAVMTSLAKAGATKLRGA